MTEYTPGERVIAAHPHPAIRRVIDQGYAFEYLVLRQSQTDSRLVTRASYRGAEVAFAAFTDRVSAPGLKGRAVFVDSAHRRRGLSTALRVFAEAVAGKPLVNVWGTDDTDEGVFVESD